MQKGHVAIVGAGPGDPDLLTVKALRLLQQAELLVTDRLIPAAFLALVSPACEVLIAKKTPGTADASQNELDEAVVAGVLAGKAVVRLKNGDPFVFGRGGEEVEWYRGHGIEPELVPGVSSALAAPLLGGVPLTMRGVADQFLVTTAHGRGGTWPELPGFIPMRTTVFLMGFQRLPLLCERLVALGYPADLPAAMVVKASHPGQVTLRGTLTTLPSLVAAAGLEAPATIIVGHVAACLDPTAKPAAPANHDGDDN